MGKRVMKKVNSMLLGMSDSIVSNTVCYGFWGEVKVPESVIKDAEEQRKSGETK